MSSGSSKKWRSLAVLAAVLLAAGLWTWRFVAVNAYYHGLVDIRKSKVYAIGDTVAASGYAPGYSIRVDGFKFVDYTALDADPELLGKLTEDKIGCLYITISKDDDSREGFPVVDLQLHGVDFQLNVYWDLLWELNPELKDSQGIILSQGDSRSYVVPFPAEKASLSAKWNRLDKIPLYLTVSSYEDIRLQ